MAHYDFMNTITIEADTEEDAVAKYHEATKHLDICLSEMEAK